MHYSKSTRDGTLKLIPREIEMQKGMHIIPESTKDGTWNFVIREV